MLEHSLVFVFPFAMAFAAVTDLFTMTIPNRLTLGLAVAFFLLAPIAGLGWQDILSHMAGGATMLLAGILLFSSGGWGRRCEAPRSRVAAGSVSISSQCF